MVPPPALSKYTTRQSRTSAKVATLFVPFQVPAVSVRVWSPPPPGCAAPLAPWTAHDHASPPRDDSPEFVDSVPASHIRLHGPVRLERWLVPTPAAEPRAPDAAASLVAGEANSDDERGSAVEPATREPSPEAAARGRETEGLVTAAIERLPDELREALLLRDTQDLAYDQIASVLDLPVGTVRSRLNRARTRLAEILQPILEDGS